MRHVHEARPCTCETHASRRLRRMSTLTTRSVSTFSWTSSAVSPSRCAASVTVQLSKGVSSLDEPLAACCVTVEWVLLVGRPHIARQPRLCDSCLCAKAGGRAC